GEAFDKVAKMLDLGYPGGPIIDKLATQGDLSYVRFPKAYLGEESLDFSFSGLKTAVLYHLKSLSRNQIEKHRADIVACFQSAVVDTLVDKTLAAARKLAVKTIVVAGGVACNSFLRKTFQQRCNEEGLKLIIPPPILCTDNAAMIARAGLFKLQQGEHSPFDLSPQPSLKL
ncbi:MAG: tRNA (adenosine(37)-N6)-threonylcarbamoyltransferase complex transferase subunit TsaD, partial [candidate division KSB1 bacterium]|nr:tRNA (adenosine(37)-N6)-threonylcarbamoyltransferase complex transferase subunit TsaD [candidate division KSB1 bacterium]